MTFLMKVAFYILIILAASACLPQGKARAEKSASVLVQNYTINDYKASCQNWELAITHTGILYAANNSGLLEFDGNEWHLHTMPDKSGLSGLYYSNDTLFSRGENSDGYWQRDRMGNMYFTPSGSRLPDYFFQKEPITGRFSPEVAAARPQSYASTPHLDFVGTMFNGLFIIDKNRNVLNHISASGLLQDNMVHDIDVQDNDLVWLALDNGITQVDIDPPLSMLGERNQIGQLLKAELVDSLLYIQTNRGYFRRSLYLNDEFVGIPADEAEQLFTPKDELFQEEYPEIFKEEELASNFGIPEYVYPVSEDLYWLVKDEEAGLFEVEEKEVRLKCRVKFDNYNLKLVTRGHRIIPFNDTLCVVATMQGVLLLNTNKLIASLTNLTMPMFRKIGYTDAEGTHLLPLDTGSISLPHDFQKLDIHVATTIFTPNHQISYKLEGVSSQWSRWQKGGEITLLQLPKGKYNLRVRKYVAEGAFPELNLRIEVKPAWYNTWYAYAAYVLLLWFAIYAGARYHVAGLRRKEQARLAQEQQEKERKLEQMKNEMLETELQNKNNELAMQTSALVKRNQAVQRILDELERQKEDLGDRYPNRLYAKLHTLIEETLENKADWLLFEASFNNAHQNFLERLRQQYSDLTPGDLRICCLLRMNLSTKEIASLMNVSVRAIELRRYRLRKRLGLDSETNLVDFLMNF